MRLLSEQELLKKDPIIAPDGYIPNSVIRRKLKPPKVDIPQRRVEKPFKLKPVPKVNVKHMPSWWSAEEKDVMTPRLEYRVMKWDDTPSPPPKSEISSVSSVSLKSLIESPVKKYIAEGRSKTTTPRSPKSKSDVKSGMQSVAKSRNDMTPVENVKKMIKANNENVKAKKSGWDDSSISDLTDTELTLTRSKVEELQKTTSLSETSLALIASGKMKPETPTYHTSSSKSSVSSGTESVRSKRIELSRYNLGMDTPDFIRRGRQSGARSDAREKSFNLTNYAVDEDSSAIHVKETKSGRRLKSHMSHVIIKQLLEEEWMPDMEADFDYDDVIDSLVTVLDNQNNPTIFDSACTYIVNLFEELGLTEEQLDYILGTLGPALDNVNSAIKKYTLRVLQTLGRRRNDVLMLLLPKLVDADESVKKAAAEAVRIMTGATDKETLLNFLESAGFTSVPYNSKMDEEYTLAMLAEKFGEHEDPEFYERVKHWVEGTTPGLFDDRDEDDTLRQESSQSRSRKEYSFMSEGKSVIDMYDTSGRNTMYADLPTTPGSLSDDELIFSRGVSIHDSKSVGMKSEKSRYNARMDLFDRAGASILPGDRFEQPTPLSDIMGNEGLNEVFLMDDRQSPFMQDPLLGLDQDAGLNFDQSPFMQDPLLRLDQEAGLSFDQEPLVKEKSDVSEGTVKSSPKSLENLLLKERTLTDLSQVGPLPNFMPRDNTGRNFDEISTDSAFESAISVSEYDTSHFSEKLTMSHTDQHSSKHSQVSEENNMFDVEQVSNLEYEGKKDGGPHTPRSRGTASTFKRRMKETDGFSTISDRSSSSRKSRRSERFTPKDPNMYKFYDEKKGGHLEKQSLKGSETESEKRARLELEEETEEKTEDQITEKIQDRDSDYHTISNLTSSQITDRLSGYDSGISKEMSEFSHGRAFGRGVPYAPLSPVKSESASPQPHSRQQSAKDWRRFFDMVPNALERKQMEQIRKEMEQGKLKHHTLPPITYFAEDLPMLPGEAGTRLLQTVRVGEKMQIPGDGRHRIESVPGKLAVHTQNEDAGLSNFGIIQMQWTTGVPTVRDRIHPPQQIPQHRSHKMIRSDESELYSGKGLSRLRQGMSEEELNLPNLDSPSLTSRYSPNHYEWEFPLPPPPAKESRTEVPEIRKDHESYCKYYHLVKKKLHLYTSPLGFIPALIAAEKERPKPKQQKERSQHLPELFVKRLRDSDKQDTASGLATLKKKISLTKTDLASSVIFPPIKLGQLVNIF